jgi:hypothetical protein
MGKRDVFTKKSSSPPGRIHSDAAVVLIRFLVTFLRAFKLHYYSLFLLFFLIKKEAKKSRLSKKKAKNFMTGQKRNELAAGAY